MPTPKTVDEYIAAAPEHTRPALEKVRKAIQQAAPKAEEKISYNIPLYSQQGHIVGFAAFKDHCSLFVTNSSVFDKFAKELAPYSRGNTKTTIHFSPDKPIPASLVKKIVTTRLAENEARAAAKAKKRR